MSVDSTCSMHRPLAKDRQRSELLADQDVRYIVERKLRGNNFHILDWSIRPFEETNGFLGLYYNIHVTVKLDGSGTKNLSFFAKTPPPAESPQNEFLQRYDTFNKEIIVYTDVLCKLGVGKGPKWLVECYLCKRNAIIVLEDAKLEGYVTHDKYVPFDESHCAWTMRALSSFHSRCLILDEKLRRTAGRTIFDLYGHLLDEVLFATDETSRNALAASVEGVYTCIDLVESLSDMEKDIVKKRVRVWASVLTKLLQPSNKYRNVICHRDIWANNLMFRYDSNGTILGCYLIDFQFIRYCPPAIDAVFCLYLNTDRATRDRHFESLLKIYHETMKRALAEEGLDVEECLPWVTFRESCEEAIHVAIIYALMNLQIMLLTSQATNEYFMGSPDRLEQVLYGDKRSELVRHQCETMEPYRARIAEVILEAFERLPDQPPIL
ncbi:hypothetical protein KPH14_006330 [Odynerus spinipes]|uniref:CHK kinase-like domain-containing protein n=1 Tax=Odynerus spinipes TaxID=1348599 RepID=A0AAD9RZB7_9HYME|nr:hypothetical protein KPH14_006330 [Odynerus spinipes]